jgi:hypothetical protein
MLLLLLLTVSRAAAARHWNPADMLLLLQLEQLPATAKSLRADATIAASLLPSFCWLKPHNLPPPGSDPLLHSNNSSVRQAPTGMLSATAAGWGHKTATGRRGGLCTDCPYCSSDASCFMLCSTSSVVCLPVSIMRDAKLLFCLQHAAWACAEMCHTTQHHSTVPEGPCRLQLPTLS